MSEHLFGLGIGHLSARAAKAAKSAGATLVNHTDPQCQCGHGCRSNCPTSQRHWFSAPNRGEPFDSATARRVCAAVLAVATQRDKRHLGIN